MSKSRLEAFTDGVIAIIITILVLGIDVPEEASFAALWEQRTQFLVYVVSFVTLAIYWNNHHHLLQIAHRISGEVMWCNIILLLFLSLLPFTTSWVNTNLLARTPELLYGAVMLLADVVWLVLAHALIRENGKDSAVYEALRNSRKSHISIALIVLGLIGGIFLPLLTFIACILSLIPWLVPDRRIERLLRHPDEHGK
jgi:uncharacterized membrane protein